jgi:hypothetical protein
MVTVPAASRRTYGLEEPSGWKDARVARPAGRGSSVRAGGRAVTVLATDPGTSA